MPTDEPELVWIIRHTDTEWSASMRHTGRTDIPLSATGREAASRLRRRLAGIRFASVVCSPLRRARETAELAGLVCSRESDDLLEWDYGDYEGLTTAEIRRERPGWDMWRDGTPGGEDAAAVGARVDAVLAELAGPPGGGAGDRGRAGGGRVRGDEGGRAGSGASGAAGGGAGGAAGDAEGAAGGGATQIALVAHAHVLRVLTARWLGLPPADGALFELEPGGVGRLGYERERRVLRGWDCA
jgi:broad specificity phosphatase PhoE